MINTLVIRLWITVLDLLTDRRRRYAAAPERGDENITKVIYAALAVTLGIAIVAAITLAVNNRLPSIQ